MKEQGIREHDPKSKLRSKRLITKIQEQEISEHDLRTTIKQQMKEQGIRDNESENLESIAGD